VTHISTLILCVVAAVLHRNRRRLGLAALAAGKTRHHQRRRRFSFPGDGSSGVGGGGPGVLRVAAAAYERRMPWCAGLAARYTAADEKAVMSLDRAKAGAIGAAAGAGETVSFKRDVRQYTLNDYQTDVR